MAELPCFELISCQGLDGELHVFTSRAAAQRFADEQNAARGVDPLEGRFDALLDEVERPSVMPPGASESAMRRAWVLGRELARLRAKP